MDSKNNIGVQLSMGFRRAIVQFTNFFRAFCRAIFLRGENTQNVGDQTMTRRSSGQLNPEYSEVLYAIKNFRAEPGKHVFSLGGKAVFTSVVAVAMSVDFPDEYLLRTSHPAIASIEDELKHPFFANLWPFVMNSAGALSYSDFRDYLVLLILGLQERFPSLKQIGFLDLVLSEWVVVTEGRISEDEVSNVIRRHRESTIDKKVYLSIDVTILSALNLDFDSMTEIARNRKISEVWTCSSLF